MQRHAWPLYAVLFASTSVLVGVLWDISWHQSIGRDSFWTPAHMAIYLGGVVAGLGSGAYVLWLSFAAAEEDRAATVGFWRYFRGPLGAWVCIWGSLAMIASAPFDDWWHNAYGLDVEILSPPHVLLALGIIAIQLGAMLMVLARQNREPHAAHLPWLYAYAAGVLILMVATLASEYMRPNHFHQQRFYVIASALFPMLLVAAGRGGLARWPATTAASFYMLFKIVMIQALQLFPATPMLAPIYNPIERMVPPTFPLLLIVPALAIDLLMRRFGRSGDWTLAAAVGAAFAGAFFVSHWYAGEFLLSEGARNFVFVADRWPYQSPPGEWRYQFWGAQSSPITAAGMALTVVVAMLSSRAGLAWGRWMTRVRR